MKKKLLNHNSFVVGRLCHTNNGENKIKQVTLFDMMGRAVSSTNVVNANKTQIDVSKLAKGFYIVRLTNRNKQTISTKLIIE